MNECPYAAPVLIQSGKAAQLQRIEFHDDFHDEDWLQQLLFEHPTRTPFDEIEPAFKGSLAIAREVQTERGPIDLLYANADGLLTLVETKLWRNPESRRQVVTQLIDYAASLSRLSYRALADAVAGASSESGDVLMGKVRKADQHFDSKRFHDAVCRNMRRGRFLLLIVGDGIQEGVEAMAEFLQGQPRLGFTLGLVEMALFRLEDGKDDPLLVQPRIVAKTATVVRAIVEVKGDQIEVSTPPQPTETVSAANITQELFLEKLAELNEPEAVDLTKWVFEHAPKHGLSIDLGKHTASLKYVEPSTGHAFRFGGLTVRGGLGVTHMVADRYQKLGLPDIIWQEYLDNLAALIPGAKHVQDGDWHQVLRGNEHEEEPPLRLLGPQREKWLALIDRTIERIRAVLAKRDS
jgi:hypothetical protein